MKSVNQIFAKDEYALDNEAVQELAAAYEALQEEHYELQSDNKSLKDRDNLFLELLRDVQFSIKMEFNNEANKQRLNIEEHIDYKAALENLQKYIRAFCKDNRIYL